ncbi:hypothetical protein [Georgenia sp. SUBG003]|uniref:hypothetical protein n=1 Tax=Georgenia sp. SUBG003 TaxID=1497974 RepID=UPI003AB4E2F8
MPDLRRHYAHDLTQDDLTVVGGLQVTTLERTAIDCALTLPPRRALPVVDSVLRMLARPNRFDRERSESAMTKARQGLRAKLADLGRRNGLVAARAALQYADGFSESPGESDLRWIAVAGGLPEPTLQLLVATDEGDFYTDMGWDLRRYAPGPLAPRRVVAEYDGAGKYLSSPESLFAEKQREDAIRARRTVMHRYVDRHLRDPRSAFTRLCHGFPRSVLDHLKPVAALMQLPTRN